MNFYHYIHSDITKCRLLGVTSVQRRLMAIQDINLVGETLASSDCANNGMDPRDSLTFVWNVDPSQSKEQARQNLKRNIVPEAAAQVILKNNMVKAQTTNSKSTEINTSHQRRWHNIVDGMYDMLRNENTGLCNNICKTFGDVLPHFIIGLDEACLMTDANGHCRIYGYATKKKH